MLAELIRIACDELPGLIDDPSTPWQTLDVLYETPRVERVWIQHGANRLNLHRIHGVPLGKSAIIHRHRWPIGVLVLDEYYDMYLSLATRVRLTRGSGYEMTHPDSQHNVMPGEHPSLSLMLSGPPWPGTKSLENPELRQFNKPLTEEAKFSLLRDIRTALVELF